MRLFACCSALAKQVMKIKELIKEINTTVYYSHDVVWCKAEMIELLGDKIYWGEEKKAIEQFLSNPSDLEVRRAMMNTFLANSLAMNHTPEHFIYDEMVDADWIEVKTEECLTIVDALISKSEKTLKDYLKEHREIAKDTLGHGNKYEYESNGDISMDFVDYAQLKENFLSRLFDAENVQFFTNSSAIEIEENEAYYPAILGIDNAKVGVLWFME